VLVGSTSRFPELVAQERGLPSAQAQISSVEPCGFWARWEPSAHTNTRIKPSSELLRRPVKSEGLSRSLLIFSERRLVIGS